MLLLLVACLAFASAGFAQVTVVRVARLLDIETGRLSAPGVIVAVSGNPRERIEAMQDVRFVMKGGSIHKRP